MVIGVNDCIFIKQSSEKVKFLNFKFILQLMIAFCQKALEIFIHRLYQFKFNN